MGHFREFGLLLVGALMAVSCTSEPAATTSTTTTVASATTATSTTTTTVPDTTTTVSEAQRIAEVTEIVREVDWTFFNAVYLKDKDMLADALAVQDRFDNGLELMERQDFFVEPPTRQGMVTEMVQVLIDREDCIAVVYRVDVTAFRGPGAVGEAAAVLWPRPSDGRWRRAYLGDEWKEACDEFSRVGQLP